MPSRRDVGSRRPGGHEHEVGRSGAPEFQRPADRRLASRLERRALDRPVAVACPDEAARAELLGLLRQLVQLPARVLRAPGDGEPAHFAARRNRVAEYRERALGERRGEVRYRHPAPQVRLVRAVRRDRLGIRHAAERAGRLAADQPHQPLHARLDDREHEILGGERDLEVDLRELGLTVGAQILVAEALHDLEVAIEPGDHQDLLEDLRRLGQRVELPGMHAARHEVVARALRRGLRQHGCLDLEEALAVEVPPDLHRRAMAQRHVVLHARSPEIDVPILEARVLGHARVVADRKWRRLRVVQQPQFLRLDLDLSRADFRVDRLGRALVDAPDHRDHILRPQPLGLLQHGLVVAGDHLRHAVAIPHVDEDERAEVADAVHPAEEHDVASDVPHGERAAGVRANEVAERSVHGDYLMLSAGSVQLSALVRCSGSRFTAPRRQRRGGGWPPRRRS